MSRISAVSSTVALCVVLLPLNISKAVVGAQEFPEAHSWHAVPTWTVGGWDGSVPFTRISEIMVGPEGRVFVTQPRTAEIWVFDEEGNRVRTVGRRGNGPGEFQEPDALFIRADTLLVWDKRMARLSRFNFEGDFFNSLPVAPLSAEFGILADGSQVFVPGGLPARRYVAGDVKHRPLRRLAPDQEGHDVIADLRSYDHWKMAVNTGKGTLFGNQPFSDHSLWETAPDGTFLLVVHRSARELKDRPVVSLSVFDSSGALSEEKDLPVTPVPLEDAAVQAAAQAQSELILSLEDRMGISSPEGAYAPHRFEEAFYIPELHPPVEDIALGTDGLIWLRRETLPSETAVDWLVLDPDLDVVARIRLPRDLEVVFPTRDAVYGAGRDEMDVFLLHRLALEKRP
jgi:hypothetical protein